MKNNLYTCRLKEDDIADVVAVHLSAFSDFFLTTLGPVFLRKYYRAVIAHPDSICIGCRDEGGAFLGFAVGNQLSKGFHLKILRDNWVVFFFEAVRLGLTRPKAIIRLWRNLNKNHSVSDDGLYAELLSIGVHSTVKGRGVGRELIGQFERIAIKSGATKVCLTTDKYENEDSLGFYLNNGYQVYYDFITYPDRKMYKLYKAFV